MKSYNIIPAKNTTQNNVYNNMYNVHLPYRRLKDDNPVYTTNGRRILSTSPLDIQLELLPYIIAALTTIPNNIGIHDPSTIDSWQTLSIEDRSTLQHTSLWYSYAAAPMFPSLLTLLPQGINLHWKHPQWFLIPATEICYLAFTFWH